MIFYVKQNMKQKLAILLSFVLLLTTVELTSGTWTTKTPMPTPRANPASAVFNDTIYVIGGSDGGIYYPKNEAYDPATDNWTTKDSLPIDAVFCRAVTVDNKIYVIGIENYSGPAFLQEYDPATGSWTSRTPMNVIRHSYAVGASQGKIYVIGGETSPDNIYLPDNEEYDPATDTWITKTPMPTARARLTVGVWHDTLFCVGGNDSDSTYAKNEAYDPVTDSWTSKANMLTARYGLASAVIEDTIYFLGGAFSMDRELNEAYVPTTDFWFSEALLPTGRGYMAASSVLDKIYAIGGLQGFDYLDVNEEFTASTSVKDSKTKKNKSTTTVLKISPNPFLDKINIVYSIRHNADNKKLNIYDLSGRLIHSLTTCNSYPGTIVWDGKNTEGKEAKAGIYFIKFNGFHPRKVIKLR
jgi:N-acetylneuraminic acid mutarotase